MLGERRLLLEANVLEVAGEAIDALGRPLIQNAVYASADTAFASEADPLVGIEIVYINLASRPGRNEQFLKTNAGLADFRRTDAVVGATLRADDLIRDGVIAEPLQHFSAGALGNALSHKKLWEHCAAANAVLTLAEADAGILGRVKEVVMYFDARPLGPRVPEFQAADYDVTPLRLVNAFGIVCYSVSPAGARRLLAACFPLRNEAIPIPGLNRHLLNISLDATMNKYYRGLNAFACFPPLVWTENEHATSDVAQT